MFGSFRPPASWYSHRARMVSENYDQATKSYLMVAKGDSRSGQLGGKAACKSQLKVSYFAVQGHSISTFCIGTLKRPFTKYNLRA